MKTTKLVKYFYLVITPFLLFGFTTDLNNAGSIINQYNVLQSAQQSKKKWVAPSIADKLKNPFDGNKEATEKGKQIFQINCFTCHGESGTGNGPGAAGLNPKPANLTSKEVQKQSDGAIYWKITTGFPPTAMISWRSNLSDNQRWEVVNYVRELGEK
ncbi:MAG TPA: cytochrome c [Ignavibacteriaceae bacterium]|nr:cytochrome c [Ignavibacteriaceae bacterium]